MENSSPAIVEMMEQGHAIVKAENDNLNTIAMQRPRKVDVLSTKALAELRAFPQFAAKSYYSIPYKDRSGPEEKTVMVEGPSIKAANALARHWGNNSSGFRIVGADDERVLVQGVFIDHETGMRRTAEISVSRKAKTRKGETYILPVDRLNMAIQAGGSKAVRNAILNALPIGLVDTYFAEAKKIAARGGSVTATATETPEQDMQHIEAEIKKSLERFAAYGVTEDDVSAYVQRHPEFENEESVSAHLVGLLNALDDGQLSPEDVFTAPDAPLAQPTKKSAPAPKAKPSGQLMKSRFPGTCAACGKRIEKGSSIYYNKDARTATHESC